METIAVYWEETVRTYGFQVEKGLCLVQAVFAPAQLGALGRELAALGKNGLRFRFMLVRGQASGLQLNLVCDATWQGRFSACRPPLVAAGAGECRVEYPVETLCFHGPHYGDRYGIAHKACQELQKEAIRYIATGCSAATLYFVFPENTAERAALALGTVFKTP